MTMSGCTIGTRSSTRRCSHASQRFKDVIALRLLLHEPLLQRVMVYMNRWSGPDVTGSGSPHPT